MNSNGFDFFHIITSSLALSCLKTDFKLKGKLNFILFPLQILSLVSNSKDVMFDIRLHNFELVFLSYFDVLIVSF